MTAAGATEAIPWPRIIALSVSQLVAWGVLYYAFAVIVEPMGTETGWTKAQMHGAQSLGLLVSGLSAYAVGRHIDRWGGRKLMFAGAALGAFAVVLWSQVTALWQLYMVCVLIGLASAMALYEAAFAVTARLVPGNYRRAITAITLLAGLASTAFVPLTHWLVTSLGWREALIILAMIELLVCSAVPLMFLRDAEAAPSQSPSWPRPSVFPMVRRRPVFWLLLCSYVCFAFFYSAVLFSLLPLLGEKGLSAAAAVALYTLIGPSQVTGRLGMFAIDRLIPTGTAGLIATSLPVIAMLVLAGLSPQSAFVYLFPVLFGAGMGIKTIVQATAAPEFLKINDYGALQGLLAMPAQMVQAGSPFIAALLWQWSGNYDALERALLVTAGLSALSFATAAWLARKG